MKKTKISILLLLLLLVSCKDSKESTDTKENTVYKPVTKEECQDFQAKLEETLNTKFDITLEKSSDFPQGIGCYLEARGTGLNFSLDKTPETISKSIGWESDGTYAAGGPTGTQEALKNGNKLIVYTVNWEEASDAKCPSDKPIGDCEIKPEKQNYSVGIWIGQL